MEHLRTAKVEALRDEYSLMAELQIEIQSRLEDLSHRSHSSKS